MVAREPRGGRPGNPAGRDAPPSACGPRPPRRRCVHHAPVDTSPRGGGPPNSRRRLRCPEAVGGLIEGVSLDPIAASRGELHGPFQRGRRRWQPDLEWRHEPGAPEVDGGPRGDEGQECRGHRWNRTLNYRTGRKAERQAEYGVCDRCGPNHLEETPFERRDGAWRIAHRVVICDWDPIDTIMEHSSRSGYASTLRSRDDPPTERLRESFIRQPNDRCRKPVLDVGRRAL